MKRILFIFMMVIHAVQSMEQPSISIQEQVAQQKVLPAGVLTYLSQLPTITQMEVDLASASTQTKAEIIAGFLLRFGGYINSNIKGTDTLISKIGDCIAQDKPILRCMPGFPISSQNKDKIPLEDNHAFSLGDFVALLTQAHVSKEIAKIHVPGSSLAIYWEPFIHTMNKVCKERLGKPLFSAERIACYQTTLKKMTAALAPHFRQPELCAEQVNQLFEVSYGDIPVAIDEEKVKHYQTFMKAELETPEWLAHAEQMLFEEKRQVLEEKYSVLKGKSFEGIQRLPVYEKNIKSNLGARKHLHRVADELGQMAFIGSKQMALLMEKEIPHFAQQIRQTIRADFASVEQKLGTPMIYGSMGTPWHKMLVVKNNGIELASDKTKERTTLAVCKIDGLELKYIDNQTPH